MTLTPYITNKQINVYYLCIGIRSRWVYNNNAVFKILIETFYNFSLIAYLLPYVHICMPTGCELFNTWPANKLKSAKYLACFKFQSVTLALKARENVVLVSISLDPDETQSYSASHPDPSCFHVFWKAFEVFRSYPIFTDHASTTCDACYHYA